MKKTFFELREYINNLPARSAWVRGVKLYALDLIDNLEEYNDYGINNGDPLDLSNSELIRKALLNGAENWKQYSFGGSAFCYDPEIANRLCTPSELRKTDFGKRKPNSQETWLDVQARALYQACKMVQDASLA